MAAADTLANDIKNLDVSDKPIEDPADDLITQWGVGVEELYKIALRFFKEKEGKELQLKYHDKLRLVAYTKQVAHGKYTTEALPDVGLLDVVGNDRRQAWQALGDLPKETAMKEFIQQLDSKTTLFKVYVKSYKSELDKVKDKQKQAEEEKKRRLEEEEAMRQKEIEKQRQHDQEMQIRAALNQQTAQQFKQYVCEQYPYNPQLQEALIEHLQEQHYQQYMQQVYQQQVLHQQQQFEQLQKIKQDKQPGGGSGGGNSDAAPLSITNGVNGSGDGSVNENEEEEEEEGEGSVNPANDSLSPLAVASMWTRKECKAFKDSLHNDKDSVMRLDSGESVTVRVPTHEEGTCLFWEFATDHYDIGFGVHFEWTISPSNTVSVHVSESSDDEEELEEEEAVDGKGDDIERGGKTPADKPPTDEIIPVYRRDCHEEVYCGSHVYPGRGVYLLKFDNSYSLWRSKTLYYRVYYSK